MLHELRACIVSADRMLLRRLGRLLESVACSAEQLIDPARAESLLSSDPPDFVIVDSAFEAATFRSICEAARYDLESGPTPVVLALVPRQTAAEVSAALTAGADDVLQKPLVAGEVLARMRAAARLREQLWRRHLQLGNSISPGCLPAPAWRALCSELARQQSGSGAVVAIHLDHLEHYQRGHGRIRAALLQGAVAQRLQSVGGEGVIWGELSDCFVALLTSSDTMAALSWAERIRLAVASEPFNLEGVSLQVTVSLGAAELGHNEAQAEAQARGAMQLAKASGRDCVVSAHEWVCECRRQAEEPVWLDSANAWDVMLPCSLTLSPEDTAEQAAALFAQTQLAHLPVVDSNGKLLGLLSARAIYAERKPDRKTVAKISPSVRFVRALMNPAAQFEEETTVRQLQTHFAEARNSVVVITRGGEPLGLLYSHTLAAMQEQLHRNSFTQGNFSLESDYLTTPEPCAVEEA